MPSQFNDNFVATDDDVGTMARVGMALDRELNGDSFQDNLNFQPRSGKREDFEPFFQDTPNTKSLSKHFHDFTMNASLETLPSVEKPRGRNMNAFEETSWNRFRKNGSLFPLSSPPISEPDLRPQALNETPDYRNRFLGAFKKQGVLDDHGNLKLDASPSFLKKPAEYTPLANRQNRNLAFDSPTEALPPKPTTPWRRNGFRSKTTPNLNSGKETPSSYKASARLMEQLGLNHSEPSVDFNNQTSYRLPNLTNLSSLIRDDTIDENGNAKEHDRLPELNTIPVASTDEQLFNAHQLLEKKFEILKRERNECNAKIDELQDKLELLTDAYNREKRRARSLEERMSKEMLTKLGESNVDDGMAASRYDTVKREKERLSEHLKSLQEQYEHIQSVYKNVLLDRESYIMRLGNKISENNELLNENRVLKEKLQTYLDKKESNVTSEIKSTAENSSKPLSMNEANERKDGLNNLLFENKSGANTKEMSNGTETAKENCSPQQDSTSPTSGYQDLVKELAKEIEMRKSLELKLKLSQSNKAGPVKHRKRRPKSKRRITGKVVFDSPNVTSGVESDEGSEEISLDSEYSDILSDDGDFEKEKQATLPRRRSSSSMKGNKLAEDSYLNEAGFDWNQGTFHNGSAFGTTGVPDEPNEEELPKHVLKQVEHIINESAAHGVGKCNTCHARQEDLIRGEQKVSHSNCLYADQTLRPSQPPNEALKTVVNQLTNELMELKKRYEKLSDRYNSLTPGYHKHKRQEIKNKLIKLIECMESKSDQIYLLYDVNVGKDFS